MASKDTAAKKEIAAAPEESHKDERSRKKDQIEKVAIRNQKIREKMGLDHDSQVKNLLETPLPVVKYLKKEEVPGKDELDKQEVNKFDVQPSEIIFKDVEPGQIYQMTVVVKNLTKTVKRIRVFQPKNSCFRCDYAMLGPIAPGLSIELVVSFESEEKGEFNDSIVIISDNTISYDVKISAYSPMAKVIFEPFVNFGFIQAGKTKTETVLFKNEGSEPGRVTIAADEIKDLKIEPKGTFVLEKDELKRVLFSYTPREPGIFRGEIKVETNGKAFTDKIDVNATCVEFLRFIINEEGEELSKIDFGAVLFGQKKKLTGHLVNNSPEGFYFRIAYLQGLHTVYKEENNILTPHEMGIQQTRRLLDIVPSEGYIKSYDQVPLTFVCRTYVEEDHQIWARNYAMATSKDEVEHKEIHQHVQATGVFFFKKTKDLDEAEENKVLMMTAEACCPRVNFDKLQEDFGKVMVGKSKQEVVKVENNSKHSTIKVECPRTSVFNCQPQEFSMSPGESVDVTISFLPKNFGNVTFECEFVINSKYKIPFKLSGLGVENLETKKPLKIKDDFLPSTIETDVKGQKDTMKGLSSSASGLHPSRSEAQIKLPPIKGTVDYLYQSRIDRMNHKKELILQKQMSSLELKAKEMMPKYNQRMGGEAPQEEWLANDIKFLFNENRDGLEPPPVEIPKKVDSLFVKKPLGKYEPLDKGGMGDFYPDPNQQLRKLPDKAYTHAMTREVHQKLTSDMLKHVHAGPKTLDFGKVFVWSRTKRYFHIKNEMKHAIKARMIIEKGDEELQESDINPQIILTGQTASFQMIFMSTKPTELTKIMSYIINDKHVFKYIVKAVAGSVELEMSDTKVDLAFADENLELSTFKFVSLKNNGNDTAYFDWYSPVPSIFRVEPQQGSVDPGLSKKVKVIFTPNGVKPVEEETLDLRIKYGNNKPLQVTGSAVDTKCDVSPTSLNFDHIAVGEPRKLEFHIKNTNTRNSAIFQIDPKSVLPHLKLHPMSGKIAPESIMKIDAEFCSKEEVPRQQKSFNIIIRGSKNITMPYSFAVIVPQVKIAEEEFDFKTITYGNSETLQMTLSNEGEIVAKLNLDLRVKEGEPETEQYLCLRVEQVRNSLDESIVIEEMDIDPDEERRKKLAKIEEEKKEQVDKDNSLDDLTIEGSQDEDKEKSVASDLPDNNNCFALTLKPKKTYKFNLTFTPQMTKLYSFNLPLTLNGDKGYRNLLRPITCRAVHPRIVLEPIDGVRDFKKKTISQMEGSGPDSLTLVVYNPDPVNTTRFFIDTTELEEHKVFHLSKAEGVVPPKDNIPIQIDFRPTKPKDWFFKLPLYVDDDRHTPKAYITLKGVSAFPRILFDRREVIMPIVPLGVESRISFNIFNDGYQTVNLKGHIIETFTHFPIKIEFPDGPSLNSKKHRTRAELSFIARSPLSFTTQLFIEDDQKTSFSILVSGTADNSILTNYSYFQRTPKEEYQLIENEDKPSYIKPAEKEQSEKSERGGGGSVAHSKTSNSTNRIGLGYPAIPFDILERACKHMAGFLNVFLPNLNLVNFPQDIITRNGEPLTKVVEYFAKSSLGVKTKFHPDMKKADKLAQTIENYKAIINFLKKEGAYLNNIRPEYLLGWHDLLLYYKKLMSGANASQQLCTSGAMKLGETAHKYLSYDSWLILMNQILKVYFVNKINLQRFKAISLLPEAQKRLPPGAEQSTIFSISELILLRWAELCLEKQREETKRLSFLNQSTVNSSFQTGVPFACLLHLYTANSWKPLRRMKDIILAKNEVVENMLVLHETFKDMGLHYVPEVAELVNLDPREEVLFMAYLFNALPNYMPKETIVFECKVDETVSKKVTLTNPTSQLLTYNVKLDAGEDFSIKEQQIKIEPRGAPAEFVITFKGRISKQVTGRLIFKPKNEGDTLMSPIVYDLKSKITGRYTVDRMIVKDVMLYDCKTKELKVTNPFNKECDFNVEVEYLPSASGDPNAKKKRFGINSSPKRGSADEKGGKLLPSFYVSQDKLSIKKNKQNKLKITYLPLTFEIHHCNVILVDEEVGELQYELVGIPMYPSPIQSYNFTTSIEQSKIPDIMVSLVYRAKHMAFTNAAKQANYVRNDKIKAALMAFLSEQREEEVFRIDCTAPKDISFPSTITIYNSKKLESMPSNEERPSNTLQVGLNMRQPVKDYSVMLIMKNSDLTDVRVYELTITILPKIFKAALDFLTPVKIPLEQGIPVSNPTDNEVVFNIAKDDAQPEEYFHVPRSFKVKGNSTEQLPVVFNPLWKGSVVSTIKVVNPVTKEEFHYQLKGQGEEPLAEAHFVIKCNVGEEKRQEINIENNDSYSTGARDFKITYEAYGITGPDRIRVEPGTQKKLALVIKPILGGIYAGCITLTDQNKKYIWYTFELEYQGRKNMRQMDVHGVIRKDNPHEIELDNPSDERIEYKVAMKGEGLHGPEAIQIPARGKAIYNLSFFPLRVLDSEGTVVFSNSRVGEILCRLNLHSTEPTPQKLPLIKCEIGKSMEQSIELDNPTNKPVKVVLQPFNSDTFVTSEKEFEIPPHGIKHVKLTYTPVEIENQTSVELNFVTENMGSWKFTAFGKGLYPTSYPVKEYVLELQRESSGNVTFKNPFKVNINVSIKLEIPDPKDEGVFDLMNKKNKFSLNPGATVQIPVSFYPNEIRDYNCCVVVYLNEKVSWRYPIKVITESKTKSVDLHISTVCRKKVEKEFTIHLPGLTTVDAQEAYHMELASVIKGDVDIVKKWFVVTNDSAFIDPTTMQLKFTVKFNPQKPLKTLGEVLITRTSGGKWR
jgi:hypothetical protein